MIENKEIKERLVNALMFNHMEPMIDLNLGRAYVDEVFAMYKGEIYISDNRCLYSDDDCYFNKYNYKNAEKFQNDFENKIIYLVRNCKTDSEKLELANNFQEYKHKIPKIGNACDKDGSIWLVRCENFKIKEEIVIKNDEDAKEYIEQKEADMKEYRDKQDKKGNNDIPEYIFGKEGITIDKKFNKIKEEISDWIDGKHSEDKVESKNENNEENNNDSKEINREIEELENEEIESDEDYDNSDYSDYE